MKKQSPKIRNSPFLMFLVGVSFFLGSGLIFYFFLLGDQKILGDYRLHYTIQWKTVAGKKLSSYYRRFYSRELETLGKKHRNHARIHFLNAIKQKDFVKKVFVDKKWVGPHHLQLEVYLPIYYVTLSNEKRVNMPILSGSGRILRHRKLDLPILQLNQGNIQIERGFLMDKRVLSWAKFGLQASQEKNLVIFPVLSELIIRESWTLARTRDLQTQFVLPKTAHKGLAERWDATYRYIIGKKMDPKISDMRGQSAIIQP